VKKLLLFVPFSVLLVAQAVAQEEQIGLPVGSAAPTVVQVQNLEGQPVSLSSRIGQKPVLIEFWATWCPLCRALMPKMEAARQKYGDRIDFVVVAVAVNETPRSIKRHLQRSPMPFEPLWDDNGAAVRAFEAPSTSYIVGVDAKGKVAYTGLGDGQDIERAVQKTLGAKAE
jgi:thiol-disulfide isomerase/thioredoxin